MPLWPGYVVNYWQSASPRESRKFLKPTIICELYRDLGESGDWGMDSGMVVGVNGGEFLVGKGETSSVGGKMQQVQVHVTCFFPARYHRIFPLSLVSFEILFIVYLYDAISIPGELGAPPIILDRPPPLGLGILDPARSWELRP